MKALILQLKEVNLSSDNLNKLISDSQKAFTNKHYEIIVADAKNVEAQVENALEANKILNDLRGLLIDSKAKGINNAGSERLLKLSNLSLCIQDV
jgi:hypothetical protein